MPSSDVLKEYCKGFARALEPWPELPLEPEPEIGWWQKIAAGRSLQGEQLLQQLLCSLPQLKLPQVEGISQSDLYRITVLRGQTASEAEYTAAGETPHWEKPGALQLWIAQHPCGAIPLLLTPCWHDFVLLVRALAHRGEPVDLANGVHAQAVSGLIQWELIQRFGRASRAKLIVLHEAPYGSVAAEQVPGGIEELAWLQASTTLRLEHELTHLATKRVLGEMRLNLLDELIADCMGMVAALGTFNSRLFGRCIGIDEGVGPIRAGRWCSYTKELDNSDCLVVIKLLFERARELEAVLSDRPDWLDPNRSMDLLQWLTKQRLDTPFAY